MIFMLLIVTIGLVVLSIKYPIGYKNIIVKYSRKYEIDPYLVASLINEIGRASCRERV